MNKKFGWCFIGASAIADKCASEAIKSDICYIASIWNRTYSKALEFANKYNVKAYEDVMDAINDPNVDGVYISLTNDMHYEYMKLCIQNHKHILCEKPFTMNEEEAKDIFALAKKNNVYVAEAMWTWFNKIPIKVKEWINNKEIGKIKEVNCYFGFIGVSKEYTVKRLVDINLLGGGLLDIGVYGIRYSLELFGMPDKVECKGILSDTGVDLKEDVIFHYDGFNVHHHFSIIDQYDERYEIIGEKGTIYLKDFHVPIVARLIKDDKKEEITDSSLLYKNQFEKCSLEINKGYLESTYVKKEETIKCMTLMDECRKQLGVIYPKEQDKKIR